MISNIIVWSIVLGTIVTTAAVQGDLKSKNKED